VPLRCGDVQEAARTDAPAGGLRDVCRRERTTPAPCLVSLQWRKSRRASESRRQGCRRSHILQALGNAGSGVLRLSRRVKRWPQIGPILWPSFLCTIGGTLPIRPGGGWWSRRGNHRSGAWRRICSGCTGECPAHYGRSGRAPARWPSGSRPFVHPHHFRPVAAP
jgi:hypothetical protein